MQLPLEVVVQLCCWFAALLSAARRWAARFLAARFAAACLAARSAAAFLAAAALVWAAARRWAATADADARATAAALACVAAESTDGVTAAVGVAGAEMVAALVDELSGAASLEQLAEPMSSAPATNAAKVRFPDNRMVPPRLVQVVAPKRSEAKGRIFGAATRS